MFLIDKYYQNANFITYHQDIINKITKSFETAEHEYNFDNITDMSNGEFFKYATNVDKELWRYSNFQHMIVYGPSGCEKKYIIDKLLEKIYNKSVIDLKDVEYTISGYSNTKTKIRIKQSKYHIIIEPNSNGFDKYLIQEIIKDYAQSQLLNIIKYKKLFKIVIINKIDDLSYSAQASLRRTMERYSNTCKFILISDQLSNIIEPIRSRCLLVRIPLPLRNQIFEILLDISIKDNINISFNKLIKIIDSSDNKINHAIWLLDIYKNNIEYNKNWELIINNIVEIVIDKNSHNNSKIFNVIKKIRELFYILFITNIPTQKIIRLVMDKLLKLSSNIQLKYNIINITSQSEHKLNQGTRHIIHIETYIIKLIKLFYMYNNNISINIYGK
jgi:replication factor C subunit 3/5